MFASGFSSCIRAYIKVENRWGSVIIIIFVKEYYTIVRSKRRITIPLGFKEREPVKIRIERVVQTEEE
ncbi:MAG: hypothetical protein ACFFD4_04975 [Candidatus Odinarchaeota archaeon]